MIDLYKLNKYFSLDWFIFSFLVLLFYLFLSFLGLSYGAYEGVVVIWLPAGIALAAFFIFGYRIWFSLFFAAFVLNYTLFNIQNTNFDEVISISLMRAFGNTIAPIFGFYFINLLTNKEHPLKNLNNIIIFILFGAILSTAISSIIGAYSSVILYNDWNAFLTIFFDWWIGNMGGIIIITPLFLNFKRKDFLLSKPSKLFEFILLTLFLYLIVQTFFIVNFILPISIVLPIILIYIFRFGKFEISLSILILTLLSVQILENPENIFYKIYPTNPIIPIVFLLISIAITSIIIAAILSDDKEKRNELLKKNIELNKWYELTIDREERTIELKNEVNELLEKQGFPKKYLKK